MRIFALGASREFGKRVAAALGRALDPLEEREFEDGEHKARALVDVQGHDAYVIQSLHGGPELSASDKLIRQLFFIAALHEHGAARVTALVPYLAFARKERQTKPWDPVHSKYVAQLFEAVGTDRLVTLEVHNVAAFQNAFRVPTLHLECADVLGDAVAQFTGAGPAVIASPDPGGVKRAQLFRESLERRLGRELGFAFLEKRRSEGKVSGSLLAGDVRDATVVLIDDLISTGGTMVRAADVCLQQGATRVVACAAHGLFNAGAEAMFASPAIARTIVTDSVPPFRLAAAARAKLQVVSAAPLFAEAIKRMAG
jgi:ribose-phosphate pyrophosphokinase